ncbi:MAG: hypothetical protein AAGG02_15400 [Cyanobacteria bacterium P01_H01_bin.15]
MLRSQFSERLASLKGGVLSAAIMIIIHLGFILGQMGLVPLTWSVALLSFIPVGLTGMVFGVTYRYTVRRDRYRQLGDGVVSAFFVTRMGGVGSELLMSRGHPALKSALPGLFILGIDTILGLALARFCLDWAQTRGWLPMAAPEIHDDSTDFDSNSDPDLSSR